MPPSQPPAITPSGSPSDLRDPARCGRIAISPGRFIAKLRASDPTFMVNLFENGGCYHLFLILQMIWPDAEPWYAFGEGHVYTRIDGVFYDIRGRAKAGDMAYSNPMTTSQQREAIGFLRARLAEHEGRLCVHD